MLIDLPSAYVERWGWESSDCSGSTLPSSVSSVLSSAQVKTGLDELKEERMPSKAIRIQELRRVSGSPVVMVAVFITSFCRQKPRGKSDWPQTERHRERASWWVRGRTYWHSRGVKCQHAAEGRLKKSFGQMSMWLIHDKILFHHLTVIMFEVQ